MDSNSSVFSEKFPHLIHIFICFACQWASRAFGILKSDHTASDINIHVYIMGYQSESHVLPITYCPKATFNTLKVSAKFFVQFGAELRETCHSVKSVIFYVHQSHKCNDTCLYLTRYYSTNMCYRLTPSGK